MSPSPAFLAMLDALRTTRGNVASCGPTGSPEPFVAFREWLRVVGEAIDKAEEELDPEPACRSCASWRRPELAGRHGECWSADRLDNDLTKGPAGYCYADRRCEAWIPNDRT